MKFKSLSIPWTLALALIGLVTAFTPHVIFAQTNQVTVEIAVLKIIPKAEARIKKLIAEKGFVNLGSEEVTLDTCTVDVNTLNSSTTNPSVVFSGSTQAAFVSHQKIQQILGIVKATKGCEISSTLQTSAVENQFAAKLDGELRTYCVSYKPAKGKFGSTVDLPVHQVIEDGTVANNVAIITEHGIKLDSTITNNRLTSLNTFTYDGETKPLTVYLPTCLTRQIKISTELKNGQALLLKSDYLTKGKSTFVNSSSQIPLLDDVPYVNRLFKNVSNLQRVPDTKTFLLVSARQK